MKTGWAKAGVTIIWGSLWGSLLMMGLRSIAPEVSQAADLQTIRDRGYIIVGIKANSVPMSFQTDLNEPVGFEVDIAKQLAIEIFGKPEAIRFKPLSNTDRLTAVTSDRVDLTIAQVTATDSRRRLVDFSAPYYFEVGAVAVGNPTIQKLNEFNGKSIAVLKDSSTAIALTEQFPKVQLRVVLSYREAFDLLQQGKVPAVAGDRLVLSQYRHQIENLRLLNDEIGLYPMAIVLPKGVQYGSLREQVNRSVNHGRQTGWLKERALKWGLYWAVDLSH
jgi:polar amino acid transport system substrate-binding protein